MILDFNKSYWNAQDINGPCHICNQQIIISSYGTINVDIYCHRCNYHIFIFNATLCYVERIITARVKHRHRVVNYMPYSIAEIKYDEGREGSSTARLIEPGLKFPCTLKDVTNFTTKYDVLG